MHLHLSGGLSGFVLAVLCTSEGTLPNLLMCSEICTFNRRIMCDSLISLSISTIIELHNKMDENTLMPKHISVAQSSMWDGKNHHFCLTVMLITKNTIIPTKIDETLWDMIYLGAVRSNKIRRCFSILLMKCCLKKGKVYMPLFDQTYSKNKNNIYEHKTNILKFIALQSEQKN